MELSSNDRSPKQSRRAEMTLVDMLITLFTRRIFLITLTGIAGVVAVVISLLIPNTYTASSRLLVPSRSGGAGLLGMLDDLPSAAKSLIGGGGGDFTRYLAILGSRSVLGNVVDRFNLIEVYELEDDDHPREAAMKELEDRVEFVIDKEFDFLSIEVTDRDPQRAAEMSNFFASELNRVDASLASQTAGNLRRYVERRYKESLAVLDSVQAGMQSFQERYGVYDLEVQMEGFFTQLVEMRVELLQLEASYETALAQFGPENPQVAALRDAVRAAQRQYQAALAGQEKLMPIPTSEVPTMARAYVDLERERMIQTRILEVIAPLLEQARMDELREVEAVQIVDAAEPPVKKSAPHRTIIVLATALSAFLLAAFYVLAKEWWRRNHVVVSARLREAAESRETQPAKA